MELKPNRSVALILAACVALVTGATGLAESPSSISSSNAQTTSPINQRPPSRNPSVRSRGLLTRNALVATPIQGSAVEVAPPANIAIPPAKPAAPTLSSQQNNRATRTADIFKDGDGYNIFVTNTCERESTKVNIRTSRPFYGVIHTKNHRQNSKCTIEAEGEQEFNLEISHVLNQKDDAYCGMVRNQVTSPDDKETLSVVLAVRVHRTIELSDDKFFILNCTNRCRNPECSSQKKSASLLSDDSGEREPTTTPATGRDGTNPDECSLDKLPHILTLLWCMGIIILGLLLTLCCICSSFFCRHVKTEIVEETPSIYEGQTDDDDEMQAYNRKHPNRIDYDNKDIYTTKNNYGSYRLDGHSASSKRRRP